MFNYWQTISCDTLSLLLLISLVNISITKATESTSFTNDQNGKRADECKTKVLNE